MRIFTGREFIILLAIVLMAAVLVATTPFVFVPDVKTGEKTFDLDPVILLLDNLAATVIASVGMSVVILAGQIDLSIGSALAVCSVIAAYASQTSLPLPIVILIPIAVGGLIGAVNGAIVAWGRIHSIIVTLGTMTILRGLIVGVVQEEWAYTGEAFKAWGTTRTLGLPTPVWIALITVPIAIYLLANTRLGREIYAVGSNINAARISGINTARIQFLTLFFNGLAIGLASVAHAPRFRAIQNNIGQGFELLVITTVVVGGTSIFGGRGSILGSVLGVLFIGLARSAMVYFHVPAIWEQAVYGTALLVAVGTDIIRTRRKILVGGVA